MLKKATKQFLTNKRYLLFGIIILILLFVRFLWLNNFPVGILHDEIDVTMSAKTYWLFGKDLSGVSFPKSLFVTKTWASLSGLPSLLLAPIYGLVRNFSPMSIRLPFVFISILISYFIFLIVKEITSNNKLAFTTLFVSLINPWLFFYSRQPTEAPFSLLFSLMAIYFFFNKNRYSVYVSITLFIASFFSYFGAKPVIPVFMVLLAIANSINLKKLINYKSIFILIAAFILPVIYIVMSNFYGGGTLSDRKDQLSFYNIDKYSNSVDEIRRASIDFKYKNLFFNKFTVFAKMSVQRFFGPFSFDYLFLTGDSVVPFQDHGVLYLFDFLMILIGLIYLVRSNDKGDRVVLITCLVLFIAGSIGPAISVMGNQYIYRAFLHIPAYIILISYGINRIGLHRVLPIYLILFINFVIFFFFRYSISQQDNHFVTERVLASYLSRIDAEKKAVVTVNETDRIFYQYSFYNNTYNDLRELPGYKEESEISIKNILFTKECSNGKSKGISIIDSKSDCPEINNDFVVIQNQKDAGVKYKIYNDVLCKGVNLTSYRREHLISDYNIEMMTDSQFCNRWIQSGKVENEKTK